MGIDNSLTTLARKLDPYIRSIVRSMLGTTGEGGSIAGSGYTIIRGRQLPEVDASGARSASALDTGEYGSESVTTTGAQADYSGILAGLDNKTYDGADKSAIIGGASNRMYGPYSAVIAGYRCDVAGASAVAIGDYVEQNNSYNYTIGYYIDYSGDAQVATYAIADYLEMSSTWQYIGENINTIQEGLQVGNNTYAAWTFSAIIVGSTLQLGALFSYKMEGLIKRGDTTTPEIVSYIITTIHSDVSTFEIQPAIVDDYFRIQVRDTANGGAGAKWVVKMETAEVGYDSEP